MGLAVDGLIVVVYLAVVVAVGLRAGRGQGKSLAEFVLGSRGSGGGGGGMPWWAVMASIIAAETSAATFISVPQEGFVKRGIVYAQIAVGLVIGRIVVGMVFLRPYYEYRVYTVYDYLGIRFGPRSKGVASALFLVMRTLASGTRLFVPSLVIVLAAKMFMGMSTTAAVTSVWPYVVAIMGLTLVTAVYTTVGGIRAVIWTDVMQAALMAVAAMVAVAVLLNAIGGFAAVGEWVPEMKTLSGYVVLGWEETTQAKWLAKSGATEMTAWEWVKLFLAEDYTLMAAVIGAAVSNIATFGTDQDMVQRLLTAPDWRKARRSLVTAAVMDLPIFATFSFIGVLLIAYYGQNPGHMPAAKADVFGHFILNYMPTGVRGLVLAGILATAMGSLSAALNSLATSATNDWWVPFAMRRSNRRVLTTEARRHGGRHGEENLGERSGGDLAAAAAETDRAAVGVARGMTVFFAAVMVIVASMFAWAKVHNPELRVIPVVLGVASLIVGPMLGMFLLGMWTTRRGSDRGNLIAMFVGLVVTLYLGGVFGMVVEGLKPPVKVSFNWFALIGASVVFGVGCLFRDDAAPARAAVAKGES